MERSFQNSREIRRCNVPNRRHEKKKKYRVVHVIVLKRFVEHEEMVRRITLLIDKDDVGIGEQN